MYLSCHIWHIWPYCCNNAWSTPFMNCSVPVLAPRLSICEAHRCVSVQATSDALRAQGNLKYTSIHDGLAPTILADRLQASLDLYNKVCAEPCATSPGHDRPSSWIKCNIPQVAPLLKEIFVHSRRSVGDLAYLQQILQLCQNLECLCCASKLLLHGQCAYCLE